MNQVQNNNKYNAILTKDSKEQKKQKKQNEVEEKSHKELIEKLTKDTKFLEALSKYLKNNQAPDQSFQFQGNKVRLHKDNAGNVIICLRNTNFATGGESKVSSGLFIPKEALKEETLEKKDLQIVALKKDSKKMERSQARKMEEEYNKNYLTTFTRNSSKNGKISIMVEKFVSQDLFDFFAKEENIEEWSCTVMHQILQELKGLHNKNVVHGDIKLQNVLLDEKKILH